MIQQWSLLLFDARVRSKVSSDRRRWCEEFGIIHGIISVSMRTLGDVERRRNMSQDRRTVDHWPNLDPGREQKTRRYAEVGALGDSHHHHHHHHVRLVEKFDTPQTNIEV